jgi:hypothetical protein
MDLSPEFTKSLLKARKPLILAVKISSNGLCAEDQIYNCFSLKQAIVNMINFSRLSKNKKNCSITLIQVPIGMSTEACRSHWMKCIRIHITQIIICLQIKENEFCITLDDINESTFKLIISKK